MTDEREQASETQGVKKVFGRRADVAPIDSESDVTTSDDDGSNTAADTVPALPGPRRQVFGVSRTTVGSRWGADLGLSAVRKDEGGAADLDVDVDVHPPTPTPLESVSAPWPSMSPVVDMVAQAIDTGPGLATTPAMQPGEWEALQEVPEAETMVETPQELLESPTMKLVEDFRERVMAILGPDHRDRWTADDADFAPGADGLPRPLVSPLDEEITEDLLHLLESKVEEFHVLGYGEVTTDDIWQYMRGLRKNRPTSLHALVNGILCLQPQAFMNFAMRKMYEHASKSTFSDLF